MEYGSGEVQPTERIRSEPQSQPEPVEEIEESAPIEEIVAVPQESQPTEKVLTQESEESILMRQREEAKRKAELEAQKAKAEAERIEREKREAAERLKREQEAKRKALDNMMDGMNKSEGTATGSEGDDSRAGDKGQPDGDPYASSYYGGPGSGSGGGGYGLGGRTLVSKGKVQQDCNQEGRVVVKIVVDRTGKVIDATPGVKGTTNNAPCLLEPAKKTAFMHKWNLDSNAPSQQIGFVVVNFKLGQ